MQGQMAGRPAVGVAHPVEERPGSWPPQTAVRSRSQQRTHEWSGLACGASMSASSGSEHAPAVAAIGVRRTFRAARGGGEVQALAGVDVRIERGEIFGLLGPNGAGKTTFIKILTTLLYPTAGEAKVVGFDVVRDAVEVRRC